MTPEELKVLIGNIIRDAAVAGTIALDPETLPEVRVERPRVREHGDWATNVAMQLGKKAGMNPREFAQLVVDKLIEDPGVDHADIAGPGFINITVNAAVAGELARTILEKGEAFGLGESLKGDVINLEYVSANPTGPIHIGGARWAAVGDSLARILEASGARVIREYYFNDHGSQIDRFAKSLLARARGLEAPEDGYGGQYIEDIARAVLEEKSNGSDPLALADEQAQEFFREHGVTRMFGEIKKELADFRVEFDVYFHEDSLHESGAVNQAIDDLRNKGVIYEQDGATWLRSTDFGDDKDRVIIKSDGDAAYFAGDIAYYLNKRERGADHVIIMLGADHHGYIGRMYAMARAFGDTAGKGENLELLIGQLVNLVQDGQPVRMSKRAGTIVVLSDLVDAAGVDAARYSLVRAAMDTTLEIDLGLISSRTNENPVYYVQYAHARTKSVDANAASHGVTREVFTPALLDSAADSELIAKLAQFPEIVAQSAQLREPHRVARYLEELAGAYHAWYGASRVTPRADEEVSDLHRTRLWLNDAAGQVLANGLSLLGVSAPEKM
ncbi:arginine--tRNA ligase [Arcanobacterium haemolyticum]|uniref:Arginine--tRNA ligase n=1 Tax=Arcanobacterium haemolyticum (strain ATCC 9345 / DSM 20595 / CCM 5947 / CCUG 17215 / LMG 16163 / NBRC 15585 / NCTC 8452 / 11018) TaxID=644284 RepID=D7BMF7_ARCHD|nr:arginine--tRNA ligase [Arcanobacterium haemolyticum]ADH92106.1 arginyl-tRNA synthetase [Arcanobacterium haemolyticum DSM 20595]QCX46273.1 arginine--tRNA ligase [Arcanobacterium haemolyticum]SQH29189.1 Arginine--tRNA ligase [Arcanobacterium haemolyticum]